MSSTELIELLGSIEYLKKHYLQYNKTTPLPTSTEQELARAFSIFFHAELEHYFEKVALKLIDDVEMKFNSGIINSSTLSIIAFCGTKFVNAGEALSGNNYRTLKSEFSKRTKDLKDQIEKNHGTSEKYISKIFIPLGISEKNIDPAWLSEINTLADDRGLFAHKSIVDSPKRPETINPADVEARYKRIIYGNGSTFTGINSIESLDAWYQTITNNHSPTISTDGFVRKILKFIKSIFK